MTEKEREQCLIADRERKEKEKAGKCQIEKDYEIIIERHQKREKRKNRSGKEHLLENLRAKKGMRLFKDDGNIQAFKRRGKINVDKMLNWQLQNSDKHKEKLENVHTDIVERLNQKRREEKEKDRKRKEEELLGEWIYNGVLLDRRK